MIGYITKFAHPIIQVNIDSSKITHHDQIQILICILFVFNVLTEFFLKPQTPELLEASSHQRY